MTSWGYARVSTLDQDPAMQLDALAAAGIDREYLVVERVSGAGTTRPALDDLLAQLDAGDVLTVWKLDRLGRSLSHLIGVVDELRRREVEFRSITEAIDTTTPTGRLMFHLVAAVAEFERELVRERTTAALAAAKASGKQLGRPTDVTPEQYRQIRRLHEEGQPQVAIAKATGLGRGTVGRALRGEIASIRGWEGQTNEPVD